MDRAADAQRPVAGRWLPLRAYLGALLVLFAITAFVSVLFVGGLENTNFVNAARGDAEFGASLAASDLGTAFAQLQATVATTAASPGLAAAFARPDCALSFSIAPFGSARLDLVRLDGTVACSSAPAPGVANQAGVSWLRDATPAAAVVGPIEDPRTKRTSAVSAAPVAGSGWVVGYVDLTDLGPSLASHFAGGPVALEFLIVSADGRTAIARSIDPAKWAGASLAGTPFAVATDPVQRPDVDGKRRIYASAAVPSLGWTLYAGADRAAAIVPATDLFQQHITITLVGMLVLLLGTLLLYRWMMAPLWRLSEAMGRGASGLTRSQVTPSGPAEIARLALRFNALASSVRDEIAVRTRAETLARISEQNYRLLFAGNPQPLFVYDLDTFAFLEVNEAAIRRYGWSREEFLSLTVDAILAPDQLPFLSSLKSTPDVHRSGPRKHRSKDGGLIDVELTSNRIAYDGHDAQLVVVDDLTAQRKLEGQLQQSQRLDTVGQLAGGIAHDFNNLLAVILNYADFVGEALPEGDLRHDVEEIQHAATRAADLTRQLLIFARREVTNPQVLDLNLVVRGVEKLLRRTIGEDIQLVLKLQNDLPSVRADPGQIEQVFLNLTLNARDAMNGGGQLVVETSAVELDSGYYAGHPDLAAGRYVRLSVSDTGSGMSKEVAARAFEPFFTTKPAGRGTGLGLATVYGIVVQAGGNIDIYSEPGTGTRVSIQLPAVDEPATITAHSDTAPLRVGDGRTVLLVEDESAVLQAAVRILTGNGYKVQARSTAAAALDVLSEPGARIDILVTDMVMPGASGVDLARRAQELRPGLPVLYMSGYSQELAAHRGTLPAESNIMRKPFTRRDLLKAVGDTLDRANVHG